MWVNAPGMNDAEHALHGSRVLVEDEYIIVYDHVQCHFVDGDLGSRMLHHSALCHGWPQATNKDTPSREQGCCHECSHYAGRGCGSSGGGNAKLPCMRYPTTVLKSPSDTCGEFNRYTGR